MKLTGRKLLLIVSALALTALIGYGMMPALVEADLAAVVRGSIRVTVDQDGKTRIREKYVVSAPLAGRLQRIELDPGDPVIGGETTLARIEPRDPELLNPRAVLQAEASVRAAEAKLRRMAPLLQEARAAQEFTEAELKRARDANARQPQAVTNSDVEEKLLAYRRASALVSSASHAEEIARFEAELARAALIRSKPPQNGGDPQIHLGPKDWSFVIRAAIDGRVLRVFQESGGFVQAGANLLELGDPRELEVEIDVLSREAVKVLAGAPVLLEHWGGPLSLNGRVRLVEPSAFTKISTLGVEEQRVNVIVDLIDPPEEREALGDGFRVDARIIVAEAQDVLKVQTSALFRAGDQWTVFVIDDGVASERGVQLGLRNGLEAEVLVGLAEGDLVVVHPGDNVSAGVAVRAR